MSRPNPTPLIYRSRLIYGAVMRFLHGRNYPNRYRAVADEILEGERVVEVCCGDCRLYEKYLAPKKVRYTGLDASPHFVRAAQARGLDVRLFDAAVETPPAAGAVILHAALHIFGPDPSGLVERLLAAASRAVIIAEPVANLATARNPLLSAIAKTLTRQRGGEAFRYNRETFTSFVSKWPELIRVSPGLDPREMVAVFRGKSGAQDRSA